MNDKTYMLLRLVMPLIALIMGLVSKDPLFYTFFVGYMLCWVFTYLYFIVFRDKKPSKKTNEAVGK